MTGATGNDGATDDVGARRAPAPDPAWPTHMIMIIRHGEKPDFTGTQGVSGEGFGDRNSLTVHGWVRAGALMELFAPAHAQPPVGLRRPDSIYGTAAEGHSKRSIETVAPLAARLGLQVHTRFADGDEKKLAKELTRRPGTSLIAWHHGSIPRIADHLGKVSPAPPRYWPVERYDVVWTFIRRDDYWEFDQFPQRLLPGDLPHPIIDWPDSSWEG
ncbi:MAG TPA: hypothetical protein VGH89_00920 [Pseudonocardia sp.]|jgi:broad specificity phosphatase PhoE